MSEPTIKQVMRCHRLMTDMVSKVQGLSSDEITELNELEQICGMFDTHEILYFEIVKLEKGLKIAVEALEFFDGVHRLHWAIDLNELPTTASRALAEIRKMRGD